MAHSRTLPPPPPNATPYYLACALNSNVQHQVAFALNSLLYSSAQCNTVINAELLDAILLSINCCIQDLHAQGLVTTDKISNSELQQQMHDSFLGIWDCVVDHGPTLTTHNKLQALMHILRNITFVPENQIALSANQDFPETKRLILELASAGGPNDLVAWWVDLRLQVLSVLTMLAGASELDEPMAALLLSFVDVYQPGFVASSMALEALARYSINHISCKTMVACAHRAVELLVNVIEYNLDYVLPDQLQADLENAMMCLYSMSQEMVSSLRDELLGARRVRLALRSVALGYKSHSGVAERARSVLELVGDERNLEFCITAIFNEK